jgi:hypothetical protein
VARAKATAVEHLSKLADEIVFDYEQLRGVLGTVRVIRLSGSVTFVSVARRGPRHQHVEFLAAARPPQIALRTVEVSSVSSTLRTFVPYSPQSPMLCTVWSTMR